MNRSIARRTLLKAAGGGVAWSLLGPSFLGASGCGPSGSLVDACIACVREVDAARVVGKAHLLSLGPSRPAATDVVRDLAGEAHEEWQRLAAEGGHGLHDAIVARHLADLETGRLLGVRGWQLSQTEVGLAALVALRES